MKIYTKTGDKGTTALFGGQRVPKHHIRIEAYGTLDELNACIGLLRDQDIDESTKTLLISIQHNLFSMGAVLATPPESETLKNGKQRLQIEQTDRSDIEVLEQAIDKMETNLDPMTHFILPGGHPIVSTCHMARTICRRAERRASHLFENEPFDEVIIQYLNRLSDFLFVLARKLTRDCDAKEVPWIPQKK